MILSNDGLNQIERHLWGWSVGRSMTKGTFPSLGAAKEHFNL